MHRPHLGTTFVALSLFATSPALATVNHGDWLGTSVDFLQVSETTLTGGDAEPLWGPPALAGSGDQLIFFPANFTSLCTSGGSDTTASDLTTTLSAHPGGHIDNVMLAENGDVTLTKFPPFGDATTNASAALSGTVTVTETTGGPITPVVIPFSGSFTPAASFALPTSFGTKVWSGSVTINVSGSVPNATKAVLTLNNSLATNCGVGNTSAKIQKKVVSGPSVAIIVNPIECELEVDKTCCVTQPPLPDFDICDGKIVKLILEYTGDKCMGSSCNQGGAFQCYGSRPIGEPADVFVYGSGMSVTPFNDIEHGDIIEVTSSTGTLPSWTKLKVTDQWWRKQTVKIETSCNRAFQCGDEFGAFTVVGLQSTLGGLVDCNAPPPEPECAPDGDPVGTQCDDPIVDMVLEYQGQPCDVPLDNPQDGYASCSGNATGATNVGVTYTGPYGYKQTVTPASGINNGDRIRVTSTYAGSGLYWLQSFKITDSGGVRQNVKMKVSCAKPFGLGDQFGSLKVVEFKTKSGFTAALGGGDPGPYETCEVPLAPTGPHCTSDLKSLSLVYIADYLNAGCTVSNPQGGYGTCSGVANPGDPVSMGVAAGLEATPYDMIEFGDVVSITPTTDGADLPSFVNFTVSGAGGNQAIQVKTSCYKPLSLGDRFGSFVVFGMDREEEGPISLGGNVQYQYKVTNPSDVSVDNIAVSDDQLGVIASGVSLAPGGTQTFTKSATLYGTTDNVATVTGDYQGNLCLPGTDTVTVGVLAPPPGSFYCSSPINELTMIWNGSQTVDIKAWHGAVGVSTMNQFDDVAPGDAITVSGLGGATPTWEIFNSAGTVKLGESKFDLSCEDSSMNSLEDCGKNNGNGKYNHMSLNNDWLLEGMIDSNETLACTPGLVPNPPACGFGPELVLIMPGLMWLHRRRMRKQA